jgi:hypothetical protein
LKPRRLWVVIALFALAGSVYAADEEESFEPGDTDLPPMVMEPEAPKTPPPKPEELPPSKPEVKAESKPEPKPEVKAEPEAKPEAKPEGEEDFDAAAMEPKPETKEEAEPEKKTEEIPPPAAASDVVISPEARKEAANASREEREKALSSPTGNFEEYEAARQELIQRSSTPKWAMNLNMEPRAFRTVDLTAPTGVNTGQPNPDLFGVFISGERVFFNRGGLLSAGAEIGLYGSTTSGPYSGLATGFFSGGPLLQYQGVYVPRQIVAPTIRTELECVRYNYKVSNVPVSGFVAMPRIDLGLLVFLNSLEPSAAGQMQANYGIKRTYVGFYYSISKDSSKSSLDLSEHEWRAGLRFEF